MSLLSSSSSPSFSFSDTVDQPCAMAGFQPTGDGRLHLGNILGSARPFALFSFPVKAAMIADAHALSLGEPPRGFSQARLRLARELIALGALDSPGSFLFFQSQVPEALALHAFLSSLAPLGDLRRMTHFESKAIEEQSAPLSLLAYPALMSADLFALGASLALVGPDQAQHLRLCAQIGARLRDRFDLDLPIPRSSELLFKVASLRDPSRKMSKSDPSDMSSIFLSDSPEMIRRKIRQAQSDSARLPDAPDLFDPIARPAAAALLDLLGAIESLPRDTLLAQMAGLGFSDLKDRLSDRLCAFLAPFQRRLADLTPGEVESALRQGAQAARERASSRYQSLLLALDRR